MVEGARKATGGKAKTRIVMTMAVFFGIYSTIAGRLVYLGFQNPDMSGGPQSRVTASRPDIVDRNGEVLATDIKTASLFAEPRRIVDADEAIEKLSTVLPEIDYEQTYHKLKSGAGFVWLQRQLTPKQQADIMQLGIPGFGFRTEKRRFYPAGETSSYIVGLTNIDNQGISGMEKYIDEQGLSDLQASGLAVAKDLKPVQLSIDLRVQHVVRDEIAAGLERYRAIGRRRRRAQRQDRRSGGDGLGAGFRSQQSLQCAGQGPAEPHVGRPLRDGLDLQELHHRHGARFRQGERWNSRFDASHPIRVGHQTIHDFHGKNRVLSVPEVFIYSSNIGSAREAEAGRHRGASRIPASPWHSGEDADRTAGGRPPDRAQGLETGQFVHHRLRPWRVDDAAAGGCRLRGADERRLSDAADIPGRAAQEEAMAVAKKVVSEKTVEGMRYLYALNAEKGSARNARVPGYRVGGKTGTAEKVVNGRYSKDMNFNTFVAAFPMDDPQYLVFTIADAPQPEKPGMTDVAASNAGVMAGNIIRRSAAMLGVKPDFSHENGATLVSYQ